MTMGAMLRFKRETGKDISLIDADVCLMTIFLFCCVASACNADGVTFDLDLDKFADGLSMDELNGFAETLSANADGSKKKPEETPPQTSTN